MKKGVFDIRIKRPCFSCDLIEWKHGRKFDYWYCPLFDKGLFGIEGAQCSLGEKENVAPCGDCNLMIERFMKIPEMQEGSDE